MNFQIGRAQGGSAWWMKTDLPGTSLSHFRALKKPEKVKTYNKQINKKNPLRLKPGHTHK